MRNQLFLHFSCLFVLLLQKYRRIIPKAIQSRCQKSLEIIKATLFFYLQFFPFFFFFIFFLSLSATLSIWKTHQVYVYLKSSGNPSCVHTAATTIYIRGWSSIKFSQVARQNQQTGRKKGEQKIEMEKKKKNINQVDF